MISNKLKLNPVPGLTFNDEGGKHIHLYNGVDEWPGCTSVSGLYSPDGWKFAWPPKLMAESLETAWLPDTAYSRPLRDQIIKEAKNAWRQKRDKAADSGTR